MTNVKTEKKLCPCCMEEHEVRTVVVRESNVFKSVPVEYDAEYFYCDRADETYAEEPQIAQNDIAMKNAYREKTGLLTSQQKAQIALADAVPGADRCNLLGREKTRLFPVGILHRDVVPNC